MGVLKTADKKGSNKAAAIVKRIRVNKGESPALHWDIVRWPESKTHLQMAPACIQISLKGESHQLRLPPEGSPPPHQNGFTHVEIKEDMEACTKVPENL